jgi:hypothetical protein
VYIILFLLTLLFCRNILPRRGKLVYGSDLAQTYYMKFLYKKFPIWNDYIYSGYPYLAHPYNQFFYPLNLLFLLPINYAYSISYILHIFLAGSFMYLLTHSLLSSICFMFSGFISNRIWAGHYEVLATSIWIPLVFYFYITSHPVLCALTLAIQFFAGHNQTSLFTFIILLSYTIYKGGSWWMLSSTILMLLGFAAIQLIPTLWFIRKSTRTTGLPFKYTIYGSLPPSHLIRFIFPNILGDYIERILGEVSWEHTYYIGLVPLIFVLRFFDYRLLWILIICLVSELIFKILWRKNILHI